MLHASAVFFVLSNGDRNVLLGAEWRAGSKEDRGNISNMTECNVAQENQAFLWPHFHE